MIDLMSVNDTAEVVCLGFLRQLMIWKSPSRFLSVVFVLCLADREAGVTLFLDDSEKCGGLFRLFGETGSSMVPWSRSELAREKDAAKFPS